MKKLMTVCAACMVAGLVSAAVESQNIVGYSTVDAPQGSSIFAPTFTTVGGGETDLTLGMITPGASFDAEDASGGGTIQFVNPDGTWGLLAQYWANYGGWFDFDDNDVNDTVLPKGGACYVYSTAASTFMCAGEISLQSFDVTIPAGSSQLGNPIPTALVLGDITASVSFDAETSLQNSIQFINPDGTWGLLAQYWANYGGWFDFDDNNVNSTPLTESSAFYVYATADATLTFPAIGI